MKAWSVGKKFLIGALCLGFVGLCVFGSGFFYSLDTEWGASMGSALFFIGLIFALPLSVFGLCMWMYALAEATGVTDRLDQQGK